MLGIRKKIILQLAVLLLLPFLQKAFGASPERCIVVQSVTITTQGENVQNTRAIPKINTKQGMLFSQADFDDDLKQQLKGTRRLYSALGVLGSLFCAVLMI